MIYNFLQFINESKSEEKIIKDIQNVLDDSLLTTYWRKNKKSSDHPTFGHCYASAEALYHILGGKENGYKPVRGKSELGTHWWIEDKEGNILDPTADQFYSVGLKPPYEDGVGAGFLTKFPSKRAKEIMRRLGYNI